MTRTIRPWFSALSGLLLLLVLTPGPAAAAAAKAPPELKARLSEALAGQGGFQDRFDAEVWLTDMAQRLRPWLPEPERRLDLLRRIHAEAHRAELSPELVLAVIQVESAFDRFAISEAGARGLMQVMPFWLEEVGKPDENLFRVGTNLRMGCTILRYYLDKESGNLTRALARYNGSLGSHVYPYKVLEALRKRWRR